MKQKQRIRLELDESALMRLLEERRLNVEEFHCLDHQSKERIKRLWLQSCDLAG